MSTEATVVESLGSPAEIADTAVREFRRRKNLLSRSWLAAFGTFVLLPLPLLVAGWVAIAIVVESIGMGLEWCGLISADAGGPETQLGVMVVHIIAILVLLIPPAVLAALYGRIARHTGRRWLWGMTACTVVGLGIGAANYELTLSNRRGESQLQFILGIGRHPLDQGLHIVLPLAVGGLVLRRSSSAGPLPHRS